MRSVMYGWNTGSRKMICAKLIMTGMRITVLSTPYMAILTPRPLGAVSSALLLPSLTTASMIGSSSSFCVADARCSFLSSELRWWYVWRGVFMTAAMPLALALVALAAFVEDLWRGGRFWVDPTSRSIARRMVGSRAPYCAPSSERLAATGDSDCVAAPGDCQSDERRRGVRAVAPVLSIRCSGCADRGSSAAAGGGQEVVRAASGGSGQQLRSKSITQLLCKLMQTVKWTTPWWSSSSMMGSNYAMLKSTIYEKPV